MLYTLLGAWLAPGDEVSRQPLPIKAPPAAVHQRAEAHGIGASIVDGLDLAPGVEQALAGKGICLHRVLEVGV